MRGTEQQTKQVATQYKTFYEKVSINGNQYVIDHTAFTYIMSRAGKYLAFFPPGTSPERMEVMVREALVNPEQVLNSQTRNKHNENNHSYYVVSGVLFKPFI